MVKDITKAIQIKELMETMLEAIQEMMKALNNRTLESFYEMSSDLREAFIQIKKAAEIEIEEQVYIELDKTVQNCIVSLDRLLRYAKYNRDKAMQKVEFELWPLMRIMYVKFYFMSLIYPDKKKMDEWYRTEGKELCKNYYLERAKKTGEYKYDVSIMVTAYNKLEYTKFCVERILANLPENIKCELILFNHGSSDGTKEFFEQICPTKQIDFAINGFGSRSVLWTFEGKYLLGISNDVLITTDMIEIMYDAFEENSDYGFAVPMTSNVSNLQVPITFNNGGKRCLPKSYDNIEEFDRYAKEINRRDKRLEEVRFRLCDPLDFMRAECYDLDGEISLLSLVVTKDYELMFPDDYRSMYIRRAGYKNIHMKDLYAHHFGSITIRDANLTAKNYSYGREKFFKKNGIDPWGKGYCWKYELFNRLLCDKANSKQVLGINCGMGSNLLKIQQEINENTGNEDVKMVSMVGDQRHVPDALAITDEVYLHNGWEDIKENIKESYDYILVDEKIEEGDYQSHVRKLYEHVALDGVLIVFVPETRDDIKKWIFDSYDDVIMTEECSITYEIDEVVTSDMPQSGNYLFWKKSNK